MHAGSICLAQGSVALCGANGLLHVLHELGRKGVGELGQGAEGALAGAERLDAKACGTAATAGPVCPAHNACLQALMLTWVGLPLHAI